MARRRPPAKGPRQRGDIAEPPPVLDLVLDRAEDHTEVRRMLVERCAVGPVWLLPGADDGVEEAHEGAEEEREGAETPARSASPRSRGPEAGTPPQGVPARRPGPLARLLGLGPRRHRPSARPVPAPAARPKPRPHVEAPSHDPEITTVELYDYIERLLDGGFAWQDSPPETPRFLRPPPPPRLPRLRSLLWLRRCDLTSIRSWTSGDDIEQTPEFGRLENSAKAQTHVINGLREARLAYAEAHRDALLDRSRQAVDRPGGAEAPSRWEITRAHTAVYWRRLASFVTRISGGVTRAAGFLSFGKFDERVLTPLGFIVSLAGAWYIPSTFLDLAAQRLNDIVSLLIGLLLAAVWMLTTFFLLLPWRPYLWLFHHRYVMDPVEGDPRGEQNPVSKGKGSSRFGRHRARGVHLLNELHDPRAVTGRISPDDRAEPSRTPGAHRVAVNALLDDLHQVYGSHRRVGRARSRRPVLVYDQRLLSPVGRYLVRLIEDERLRRAHPDPLLLVQIRDTGREESLVSEDISVSRYERLPEFDGTDRRPRPVRRWLRARYLAGALGAHRTLSLRVAALPPAWTDRSWRAQPTWVLTRPARAGVLTGAGAASTALFVLVALIFVPTQVQMIRHCVQDGVLQPPGITKVGSECVGVTFGDFVFNERLEQVTDLIRRQNEAVDDSGAPYVTIAHIGEQSIADPDDPSLAGIQGELLGLAYQQREHNADRDTNRPAIKLLIGNAGEGWAHAVTTAEEIVRRAGDTRRGMDRPIAAVGFGHSVVNNSRAVQKVGEATMTMVGTTATFDDVAQYGEREHSEFYFPVAPSNSRMAEQSAHWALHGVPWTAPSGQEHGLPAHETAVAIASAERDASGDDHEQYGPDLARRFMTAFVDGGGGVWEGAQDLGSDEYDDQGVLLYQSGELETDTTYKEHLDRLCSDEDPPELLYYAGRSDDFTRFYRDFMRSGGEECNGGGMTILGGDDISKFVSDSEVLIERNSVHHPVFYTPLAPSGPWGVHGEDTGGSDQGFYDDIEELLTDLYGSAAGGSPDPEEAENEGREAGAGTPDRGDDPGARSDDRMPSIAHAAVGNDALLVIARALPPIGLTKEEQDDREILRRFGLVSSPFLRTEEDYVEKRDALHGTVKASSTFTGVTGFITFDSANDGNWFAGRMVQLVLVGPLARNEETGQTQRQHVLERCGMRNSTTPEPGDQCLPVERERNRE